MFADKIRIELIPDKKAIISSIKTDTDISNGTIINRDFKKKFKGKIFESGFKIERLKKGKTAFTPVLSGLIHEYDKGILLEVDIKINPVLNNLVRIICFSKINSLKLENCIF